MALAAVEVAQRKPHKSGFAVHPGQELHRVESGHSPDDRAALAVSPTVAGDAAHRSVLPVMLAGEIRGGGGDEALQLLVVKVAGDAERVVAFLGGECHEEERAQEQGSRPARRPEGEGPSKRAGDGERLLRRRASEP